MKYGHEMIYSDYVEFYELTTKSVELSVFDSITVMSTKYLLDDQIEINILFSILYMAMIAEEKKENTRLGKRIKRLGIYMLLFENASVSVAANFMRGMKWREIAALCEERGF